MSSDSDKLRRAQELARAEALRRKGTTKPEAPSPIPAPLQEEPAVPFPLGVLPVELQRWAQAVAVFNQVPPSMPATFALMAAMTAAARMSVQIVPGWTEPTVGQILLIASPSERKSPVFGAAFAPIYQWRKNEKSRAARERSEIQRQISEETVDEDGNAIAVKSGSPEARRIADLKERLNQIKPARRRIADDVTPEEFMRQMDENEGCMCLVSDEADVFQSFGGRYAQGEPKLGPLLKGWDGKQPLMYDRVGGGGGKQRINIMIDEPRAGIAIAGQYTILDVLKKNAVYREKGMLARMLYVVLPERQSPRALTPQRIDGTLHGAYNDAIMRLFDGDIDAPLTLANKLEYENGWLMPKWLMDLRYRVEVGLLGDGEFAQIRDWAGKLVSNMARVGAVLEAMGGGGEEQLAELCEFFIVHAKRALGGPDSMAPSAGTAADELASIVERLAAKFPPAPADAGAPTSKSKPFGVRDVRRCWRRLQGMSSEQLTQRIEHLVALGHLEEVPNEDAGRLGNRQTARRFQLIVQLGVEKRAQSVEAIPTEMPETPMDVGNPEDWIDDL